jgi:carbon monoxide dehydrogenase subunit G
VIIEKEIHLDASQDRVWALINDPEALSRCVPGLESMSVIDDRHYETVVRMSIGPIHARFHLHTTIESLEPPTTAVLLTEGHDRGIAGRVKQRQTFALEPDGDGTLVRIHTEVSISGRFATFGQRVIASQADTFADEVAANVAKLLAEGGVGST